MKLSKVLVLDLDGTIIGDVSHWVLQYSLINELYEDDPRQRSKEITKFKARLTDAMKYTGLMRPYTTRFMRSMHHRSGYELFVYTASEQNWAKLVIGCVENATGVKFNRPIFSRLHCKLDGFEYKKNLKSIAPKIVNHLKHTYPTVTMNQVYSKDVLHFVDNTPFVLDNEFERRSFLTVCPTYAFLSVHDVLGSFTFKQLFHNYTRFEELLKLSERATSPSKYKDFQLFQAKYYKTIYNNMHHAAKDNFLSTKDRFFKLLMNV